MRSESPPEKSDRLDQERLENLKIKNEIFKKTFGNYNDSSNLHNIFNLKRRKSDESKKESFLIHPFLFQMKKEASPKTPKMELQEQREKREFLLTLKRNLNIKYNQIF